MRRLVALIPLLFLAPNMFGAEKSGWFGTAFYPQSGLFSGLYFGFPIRSRLGLVAELSVSRANESRTIPPPGIMGGIEFRIPRTTLHTLLGISNKKFAIQGNVYTGIRRFGLEFIIKYVKPSTWIRARPRILLQKSLSIGLEYTHSSWKLSNDPALYYVTHGGGFVRLDFPRFNVTAGGGTGSKSQGGYFFLEIASQLF